MLNIDRKSLLGLDGNFLKKQRTLLLVISFLLLLGGIFCLINPFASGAALSAIVGTMFMLSGIGLIIGMIANRTRNFWPMVAGILMGVAYIIMGYVFITNPMVGIFTMSVILATLFALGGIIRLSAGYKLRGVSGGWLQIIIGILDLAIAAMFITAGPAMSVTLVTTIVGIEMLFSSFSCFQIAGMFKREA